MNTKNLKTISTIVSSTVVASALVAGIAPGTAHAQTSKNTKTRVTAKPAVKQTGFRTKRINPASKRVSMELQNASVRKALTQLFLQTGADFSIDSRIAGNVTMKLRNQPFTTALKTLVENSSQPLTYAVENGTYFVKPAGQVTSVAATNRVARTAPVDATAVADTAPAPAYNPYANAQPLGANTVFVPTTGPLYTGNTVLLPGGYGNYAGFDPYGGYGYSNPGFGYGNAGFYGNSYGGNSITINGPGFYNQSTGIGAFYGAPNGVNFYNTRGIYFAN